MKSCQETRLKNIDRWRRVIRKSQNTYSQKRAIGLLLRAIMYGNKEPLSLTLHEASVITGMPETDLDKLYQKHRGDGRWIYHTRDKMFYYDGG